MSSFRNDNSDSNSSFKVFIRIRPFNDYQLKMTSNRDYINYDQSQISVKIRNDNQRFTFDKVYHPITSQEEIFETVADDIIDNAFMGINGTIFCYGQTASGKTHTIVGDYASQFSQNQGLLPRILRDVIQRKNTKIENVKQSNLDIRIKVSMIEIYNEKIMDLFDLNKRDLKLRENKKQGVFIEHVSEKYIVNAEEAMNMVKLGLENRTVGRTNLNAYSSRSHMVFIITIHETNFQTREAKSAKITLTDLAGSEKLSKTGVQGKMLIQAKKINTSLSTLGKVIQALSQKSNHIPYRDSKLTRLLQESIGGNSLTRLIINVSPSYINEYETMTSLRFGSRAKLIKNKPKVNKQYTVEELLILLEKAELKIKYQMKLIEELQQGNTSQFSRRNGGFAGLGGYEKSITLHMIGDDDEEFDDSSSVGSHSMVKSVASHQDNCNVSIFGDTGVFFNQTADFQFEAPSSKKKTRKPNLCYSKSLKAIPTMDMEDDQQFDDMMFSKRQQPPSRKQKKTVTIMDQKNLIENSDNQDHNGTIYEENESCIEESLKNSTGLNFELPCKSIHKDEVEENKDDEKDKEKSLGDQKQKQLQKSDVQSGDTIKLSDITNNESNTNEFSPSNGSRPLSKSPKDRQNSKENEVASIRQEIKEQLKEQLKQQIKEQLKQQIKEQIKQEIQQKIKQEFKQQIQTLSTKVSTMAVQLKTAQVKFEEVTVKYEQTVQLIEQQKQAIKSKDQHIVQLKDKYKAKKNQINKEINKLKNFWQIGM